MYILLILYSFLILQHKGQCLNISNIEVWGPGIDPQNIILPARYIFIAADRTSSESTLDNFHFEIKGLNGNKPCRIRSNVLDRRDGSFIFRYKMYEFCDSLQINLRYKNHHIGASPYIFKNVLSEECNCPTDLKKVLNSFQCGDVPEQITRDLNKFSKIKWSELRSRVIESFDSPGAISLCHYVIKNNAIKRKCYGKYTGFKMFSDSILLSLTRKIQLPDVELFINLGDWPLTSKSRKYPIFSWCGSSNSYDIVMPTYDITESTLENLGRVTLDMLSVQGNTELPWENRIPKAFWRGRDSNKYRLKLVDIARENPNLFNVSLVNFFFFRDKEAEYGKEDYISFYKFFDYKYEVTIDGTVAAYRVPYLLAGGSLVFKQNSMYYEHFYNNLKPNVHYIPIKEDLSDLVEKLKWAKTNDEDAKKIALAGQRFAQENLLPTNIYCYYIQLLNQYSKLLIEPVEDLEDMELVEQVEETKKCKCSFKNQKDEL